MPTPTYTPLANITLGSTAASVTFSSISGYRDLVLVVNAKSVSGQDVSGIQFNNDTTSTYYLVAMEGNGSSTSSSAPAAQNAIYATWSNNNISNTELNVQTWSVMDYSATDKHKSVLVRSNVAGLETAAVAGRWANTAAVTTLKIINTSYSFAAGSTFALYGIAA